MLLQVEMIYESCIWSLLKVVLLLRLTKNLKPGTLPINHLSIKSMQKMVPIYQMSPRSQSDK